MKRLRIYVDTSVIGGCFDQEFQEDSRALINMAKTGEACLLVSQLLVDELKDAPDYIQRIIIDVPGNNVEAILFNMEALQLREAYLEAGVIGRNHAMDAHHVALATVARADVIVSWNFKHIVHFDKIRGFNAVNLREGYMPVEIRAPKEVV